LSVPISLAVNGTLRNGELLALWQAAWGHPLAAGYDKVLARSLCNITARSAGRLVGFVNVATDGGVHAFILDTTVTRRRGAKASAAPLSERRPRQPGRTAPTGCMSTTSRTLPTFIAAAASSPQRLG
jgi:hypothetical protein